jgi:hypothetical protein
LVNNTHVRAEVLTTGRMIPSGTNRSPVDVSTQTKKLDPVSKLGVPATQVEHTGIYIVRRMHVCLTDMVYLIYFSIEIYNSYVMY